MDTISLLKRFDPASLNARHDVHVHEASLAFTRPPENLPAFAQHCTTCVADELAEAYREVERLRAALELFAADENWAPELSDSDEFPPRAFWSGPFDPQGIAARALRGE